MSFLQRSRQFRASTISLFNQGSIPKHSPRDTVAILANVLPEAKSKTEADCITNYLTERVIGMNSIEAFQTLHTIHRYRAVTKCTPELLNDLMVALLHQCNLPETELVRGLELVAELSGPQWDPLEASKHETYNKLSLKAKDVDTLIRIGLLGINYDAKINSRLVDIAKSDKLSTYNLARIGYLTGEHDIIHQSFLERPTCESLSFTLRAMAAWSQSNSLDGKKILDITNQLVPQMRPATAQICLWALIATESIDNIQLTKLNDVAARSVWRDHIRHLQCYMAINSSPPSYPIRVPQLGIARKHAYSKQLIRALRDRNVQVVENPSIGHYSFDIQLPATNRVIDITTFPFSPDYKIHKRYIPHQVTEIPIEEDISRIVDLLVHS